MAGYDNPRIVDIENEALRSRLSSIKGGAQALIDAVQRYVEPKKGDAYCSRTEILRLRDELKRLLK